jgi:prephenate dehydratase
MPTTIRNESAHEESAAPEGDVRRGKLGPVTTTRETGRIAYQGEPGSNSHLVCTEAYPDWEAMACASFEDVFAAVENHQADLGLIPIDNSLAGRVADIHHFLPTSTLHIVAEHFLRIRFALMALPGATTQTIKTVHSHVHALGQCRRIIREHDLQPVISGDTAGAAREVAEAGDPTQAAIAPPLAAAIYGLEILADDVEDEDHNTTRFVVLSRDLVRAAQGDGPVVTSFVFNVRNLPAALYKALGGFATNGVNMTKLESYMVGGHFAATQFLAEVDGHPDDDGVRRALEELEFFTTDVRILGVYPAGPGRRE